MSHVKKNEVMAEADLTIPLAVRVLHGLKLKRDFSIHRVHKDATLSSVAEKIITGQCDMGDGFLLGLSSSSISKSSAKSFSTKTTSTHSVCSLISDDEEEDGQSGSAAGLDMSTQSATSAASQEEETSFSSELTSVSTPSKTSVSASKNSSSSSAMACRPIHSLKIKVGFLQTNDNNCCKYVFMMHVQCT